MRECTFIEVTDTSISKKVLINVAWIKSVFPMDDNLTAIIVGDGYPVTQENQPERYVISESYEQIRTLLALYTGGRVIAPKAEAE